MLCSALTPSAWLESATGHPPGGLEWGPLLFKAMLVVNAILLWKLRFAAAGRALDLESWWPSRRAMAMLGVLLTAAFVLRVYKLETCLWLDEVFALVESIRPPALTILTSFPTQNNHMLYSVLAHACSSVAGESFAAIRVPAVVFGVASIVPMFLLARKLAGEAEALLACAVMTFSYHHVWFSQSARGYTGLLLFALLATWLWLEARDCGGNWWLAYAVACFFGMWVHMTMAFVLAGHGIAWIASFRETRWAPIPAWIATVTATTQVYALALPEFLRSAAGEVSLPSQWIRPAWLAGEIVRSLSVAFAGVAVVAIGGIIAAAGFITIWRRDRAAALQLVLPGAICAAAMLALGHNLWPRFFFFSMGFGLLVAIRGAFAVAPSAKLGTALAGLLIAASIYTLPRVYSFPKQDFTGARDWVESQRSGAERIAAVGLAAKVYPYFAPAWPAPATDAEFARLAEPEWVVYTLPPQLQAWHPDIWRTVHERYELARTFPGTLGAGEVIVCRARKRGAL